MDGPIVRCTVPLYMAIPSSVQGSLSLPTAAYRLSDRSKSIGGTGSLKDCCTLLPTDTPNSNSVAAALLSLRPCS